MDVVVLALIIVAAILALIEFVRGPSVLAAAVFVLALALLLPRIAG